MNSLVDLKTKNGTTCNKQTRLMALTFLLTSSTFLAAFVIILEFSGYSSVTFLAYQRKLDALSNVDSSFGYYFIAVAGSTIGLFCCSMLNNFGEKNSLLLNLFQLFFFLFTSFCILCLGFSLFFGTISAIGPDKSLYLASTAFLVNGLALLVMGLFGLIGQHKSKVLYKRFFGIGLVTIIVAGVGISLIMFFVGPHDHTGRDFIYAPIGGLVIFGLDLIAFQLLKQRPEFKQITNESSNKTIRTLVIFCGGVLLNACAIIYLFGFWLLIRSTRLYSNTSP